MTLVALEEIRRRMGDRKLSVVAKAIGVRHATLSAIRDGATKPTYETLRKLSEYFDAS